MLVSVIVPIYNVEKYLERGIDSILRQTCGDFELLLIDDGSTDQSGEICDRYAEKDDRIRVFHKLNGGVGSARNLGLDNAKGKYIYFADPDDYLEADLLESMLGAISESGMSVCGYYKDVSQDDKIQNKQIMNHFGGGTFVEKLCILHKNTLLFVTWNKLFKNEVIQNNKIRYKEMVWREDAIFVYNYLSYIDSIAFVPKPLYHYIKYASERVSATGKFVHDYYRTITIKLFRAGMEFCDKWKDDKAIDAFIQCQYDHYISEIGGDLIVNLARSAYTKQEKLAYITNVLKQVKKEKFKVKLSHFSSVSDKLSAIFIRIHFSHGMYWLEEMYKYKNGISV